MRTCAPSELAARRRPRGQGARLQRGQRRHLRDGLQRGLHRRVRALQAARAHDVRHQRRPAAADFRYQGGQGAGSVADDGMAEPLLN